MSVAPRSSARAARLGFEKLAVELVTCAYGAVLVASARPALIPMNLRLVMRIVTLDTLFSRPYKQADATTSVGTRPSPRRRIDPASRSNLEAHVHAYGVVTSD